MRHEFSARFKRSRLHHFPPLSGFNSGMRFVLLRQYCLHDAMTTDPQAFRQSNYHRRFTYVIRLQLHSAAEDEGVEVGLLEDFVKGGFVLESRHIYSINNLKSV